MNKSIIGREQESTLLETLLCSDSAEFLAVYGRRRVGKTYLIREYFSNREDIIFFNATGMKDGSMAEQLANFIEEVGGTFLYEGARLEVGKNWREIFKTLTDNIKASAHDKKIVLFFDEFPWMATKNSRLLQNLEYYWNQHWSKDHRVKLIICGSSASWIINKVINNKGGLHNRVTHSIFLEPLKLCQTKSLLKACGVNLINKHIAELYMVMGGIPFYLKKAAIKKLSATQIVEELAFRQKSFFMSEFENLYAALFTNADIYVDIVKEIAAHRYGIGQEQLFKKIGKVVQGKSGVDKMQALVDTSFIINFKPLYHKKRGIYYRVIDQYSLFYFHWIQPAKDTLLKRSLVKGYWDKLKKKPSWYSWAGLAFESICYDHLPQIIHGLSLSPTALPSTWRHVPSKDDGDKGAQIDLLFDRDDDAITVCEIKYTKKPFVITKEYAEKLKEKIMVFQRKTRTKKQIFIAFISASGVKQNKYYDELVSGVVTLDDLFKEI